MTAYRAGGTVVRLKPQVLTRGGEGSIYAIEGRPGQLAKIYAAWPSPAKERKLAWMIAHPPRRPQALPGHQVFAWPEAILRDDDGAAVGFVMPAVRDAVTLFEVWDPAARRRLYPHFTWKSLHDTALNLARAVAACHAQDYVIGDLNEKNVLVTTDGVVSLIDIDSFQVRERTPSGMVVHRCGVGHPAYCPPELIGLDFAAVDRTPAHDLYLLAVMSFFLLMDANSPFRATCDGASGTLGESEREKQGLFPHAGPGARTCHPPPDMPPFAALHPTLQALFGRCFVDGYRDASNRPAAREWIDGLAEASAALVKCRNGHLYVASHGQCHHRTNGRPCTVATPTARFNRSTARTPAHPPPPPPTSAQRRFTWPDDTPPQHMTPVSPARSPVQTLIRGAGNGIGWIKQAVVGPIRTPVTIAVCLLALQVSTGAVGAAIGRLDTVIPSARIQHVLLPPEDATPANPIASRGGATSAYPIVASGGSANGSAPAAMYDNQTTTYWSASVSATTRTGRVYVDLGTTQDIGFIRYLVPPSANFAYVRVQISDDGRTWRTITTVTSADRKAGQWRRLRVEQRARFVSFSFRADDQATTIAGVAEVQVFPVAVGTPAVATTQPTAPPQTRTPTAPPIQPAKRGARDES